MKQISAAFVKAKRSFGPALKDKTNPHFRSNYADLGNCLAAVEDALLENGIALLQETFEDSTGVTVETVLLHESGEERRFGKLHVPAAKQDPQGYGSALTYARRYSLMTACGIAPEDDDGNAAVAPKTGPRGIVTGARDGIGEDLPEDWKVYLRDLADEATEFVRQGDLKSALETINRDKLDDAQMTYLHNHMDSKTRSAIKTPQKAKQ